ncbi:MAG: hypothetical protein WA766_13035 [Candidatus Acidiferrales bacterium]|jgi:hypothetical protein
MTGNPEKSLTIDTHHHILPDFVWQATENAHAARRGGDQRLNDAPFGVR